VEPDALIQYLKTLEEKIDLLTEAVKVQKKKDRLLSEWIEEKEVIAMTGLSRNTLLKLRNEGRITRSTLAGKQNYYRISDFKKLLDRNEIEK
jgi:hypothetical protein